MDEPSEVKRWKCLTQEVADSKLNKEDISEHKGCITIVGSGIMCVSHFTLEALGYIKSCDKVFFCVADPVTENYIRKLRPDAMDLYVLYNDDKERYITYVQMSEIMLHEARKGFHVVGIFYGHPGVFVLPSHRALQIAEKEGMNVKMLAAPSAEDCLFADLRIDPSFPGCQSFEATDLLLRKRHICPDMHVIIWQVGCVGNTGFRFKGYSNENLNVLIEHLQGIYGKDYELLHYIGAQYPVCDPVKEKLKLSDFEKDDIRKKVTGISTFYLPPKEQKQTNTDVAMSLGMVLVSPSKEVSTVTRAIGGYTDRENKAISLLKDWTLPNNYMFSIPSNLSTYLQDLSMNPTVNLCRVSLSEAERRVANSKHSGRIRMSLKGKSNDVAEAVAKKIFTDGNFAANYFAIFQSIEEETTSFEIVDIWLQQHGYTTTAQEVQTAMDNLLKSSLLPWSNTYDTNLGVPLYIDGKTNETSPLIMWDAKIIKGAKFADGVLTWSTDSGNGENGDIAFRRKLFVDDFTNPDDIAGEDAPKVHIQGYVWKLDEEKPDKPNIDTEFSPVSVIGISTFLGTYTLSGKSPSTNATVESYLLTIANKDSEISIEFSGRQIVHPKYSSCCLKWTTPENEDNAILCLLEEFDGRKFILKVKGKLWKEGNEPGTYNVFGKMEKSSLLPWVCRYRSYLKNDHGPEVRLERSQETDMVEIYVSGTRITYEQTSDTTVQWTFDDKNYKTQFYQKEQSDHKRFVGTVWRKNDKEPDKSNFFGEEDTEYLVPWSAYYQTWITSEDQPAQPCEFVLVGTSNIATSKLIIGGYPVKELQFNNPVLTWTHTDKVINGEITFYMKNDSRVRRFVGKVWKPQQPKPDKLNINGVVDEAYLLSWSGLYYTHMNKGGKWESGGPQLKIIGDSTQEKSVVILDGAVIQNWSFNNPNMSWNDEENTTSADILFFFTTKENLKEDRRDPGPHFSGKLWKHSEKKPESTNWIGDQKTPAPPLTFQETWQQFLFGVATGVATMVVFEVLKKMFRGVRKCFAALTRIRGGVADVIDVAGELDPIPEPPGPEPALTTTDTTTETTESTTDTTTETTETTTEITEVTTETTDIVTEITEIVTETAEIVAEIVAI